MLIVVGLCTIDYVAFGQKRQPLCGAYMTLYEIR